MLEPQHFCVAASSERESARRQTAGLETSEGVTWAMGDALGTVWSAFAGEKIALIQRALKLYRILVLCIEY